MIVKKNQDQNKKLEKTPEDLTINFSTTSLPFVADRFWYYYDQMKNNLFGWLKMAHQPHLAIYPMQDMFCEKMYGWGVLRYQQDARGFQLVRVLYLSPQAAHPIMFVVNAVHPTQEDRNMVVGYAYPVASRDKVGLVEFVWHSREYKQNDDKQKSKNNDREYQLVCLPKEIDGLAKWVFTECFKRYTNKFFERIPSFFPRQQDKKLVSKVICPSSLDTIPSLGYHSQPKEKHKHGRSVKKDWQWVFLKTPK
jgi:hypothetical protein